MEYIISAYNYLEEHPFASYALQGSILSFFIWLLYLELSPKLGGIFFRPDDTGTFKFRLVGVLPLLAHPFQGTLFWYPNNWDMNFIMTSTLGGLIYAFLKYYQNHSLYPR